MLISMEIISTAIRLQTELMLWVKGRDFAWSNAT